MYSHVTFSLRDKIEDRIVSFKFVDRALSSGADLGLHGEKGGTASYSGTNSKVKDFHVYDHDVYRLPINICSNK